MNEMNAACLGIRDLDVTSVEGSEHTMKVLDGALKKLSESRSKIRAQKNRLEHIIVNENNIVENTTAAELRIRDTDMAEEKVEYSKKNILVQANQATQGVLSLLK